MSRPSLFRDISPPPVRRTISAVVEDHKTEPVKNLSSVTPQTEPSPASIEAGKTTVDDHLEYFSRRFQPVCRFDGGAGPRLSIPAFRDLYLQHQHDAGCHFVVHQHDHPIAGVHYDLRLQFSATSTISFAIPYGLPGNANSRRPNRMAIETRVHNRWNNLIESASHATGSLLIWDTGSYEILPYRQDRALPATDDDLTDAESPSPQVASSNSQMLFSAFQDKHIRLRLHGCRLPHRYTITLRLTKSDKYQHKPASRPLAKRRRVSRKSTANSREPRKDSEDSSESTRTRSPFPILGEQAAVDAGLASGDDDADVDDTEDAAIRANNAYTGSTNTIGSVHQRHWFLSLDKNNSGFVKTGPGGDRDTKWDGGWEPFFVMGRDVERSVVTGRTADQVMSDEGVKAFAGRKMWRRSSSDASTFNSHGLDAKYIF